MKTDVELVYVTDTLCGWCWGFTPVVKRLQSENPWPVTVLSGGLVTGDRVGPVGEMAPYILKAIDTVTEKTGAVFGENYRKMLRENVQIQDSLPPAAAIVTARERDEKRAVEFAHALQVLHFGEALSLREEGSLARVAAQFGWDGEAFEKEARSGERLEQASREFAVVSEMGIRGFPALLLRVGDEWSLVTHGFAPYEEVHAKILELTN